MNEIIRKAVEELKAEKPDLSYIRGMLETVLAMSSEEPKKGYVERPIDVNKTIEEYKATTPMDEGGVLDSLAKAGLASIQPAVQE